MLYGMVMADAITHGQLPVPRPGYSVGESAISGSFPSAAAIQEDDWCRAITHRLRSLPDAHPLHPSTTSPQEIVSSPQGAILSSLRARLANLPDLLLQMDQPGQISPYDQFSRGEELLSDPWQQSLFAVCQQATSSLLYLQRTITLRRNEPGFCGPGDCLSIAIDCVLSARGDFVIAVGQGLHRYPDQVGLPVVTGILSAGWGGYQSLPLSLKHALRAPTPTLENWLRSRWHITGDQDIEDWGRSLWLNWSGCDPANWEKQGSMAVRPIGGDASTGSKI